MKLNKKQQEIALEKLQKHFSKKCDVCEENEWLLNDTVFEMREFDNGNITIGGKSKVFPIINVSCKECGQTISFNAILLGIIEKDNKKQ